MANRPLSQDEVNTLIRYHDNTQMGPSKILSVFSKDETIQILNAVTESKTTTADGKWRITYKGKGFIVQSVGGMVPMGNFPDTDAIITRLSL